MVDELGKPTVEAEHEMVYAQCPNVYHLCILQGVAKHWPIVLLNSNEVAGQTMVPWLTGAEPAAAEHWNPLAALI